MGSKNKLKEAFEPEAKFGAFYTGGNIEWHGNYLYCQNATNISKVDIETGVVAQEIAKVDTAEQDHDTILTFTTDGNNVVTAHKSGLFKLWNAANELEKQWKCIHKGPVASLQLNELTLLSGGSDGIVRVWDLAYQACTSALKGCTGVINVLTSNEKCIYASGDDGVIIAWSNGTVRQSYSGHFSKVTSIQFSNDGAHFVSAGRDKVLILWQINDGHALRTVPVYQTIEGILVLPIQVTLPVVGTVGDASDILVMCAGENGAISVWDVKKSKEICKQDNSLINKATVEGSLAVTHLLADASKERVALVSAEHNIILHDCKTFDVVKQFVGFSDEILDIVFCGPENAYLAIATNSNDIKLYHNVTMNCQLLRGHQDIILALSVASFNTQLLASCGKDNTVRVWRIDTNCMCLAIGVRHTATVSSVCFFTNSNFLISGSQDNCVKLWQLPEKLDKLVDSTDLIAVHTEIAHSKDINAIAVSPNDKLVASCSQDKTIKLFTENLTLVGVLKGHRRGVWCCRFSPVDQVLATSSADCTIKLWSITELNCLKTLEAHDASVLRIDFLSAGMQLLSAGADGLVKLFDIKTSECQLTLDEHDGRIWSLCVAADERTFVTGGSDSLLIKWKDVTQQKHLEQQEQREAEVLEEQQLANYLQQDQLLKALKLGLKLNKPFTVLKIVQGVVRKGDAPLIGEAVANLNEYEKQTLLQCATDWNTNSRSCQAAQLVLNILLQEVQAGSFKPGNLASSIEANLGYTQRHYKRLTGLMQDLRFIDFTINCMQPYSTS